MFHPWSLVIPVMILLPNLSFLLLQPRNMPGPTEEGKKPFVFAAAEGAGRIGAFAIPVFYPMHLEQWFEMASLAGMLVFLLLYYWGWMRYYAKGREFADLFASLLGVPVPMAVGPALYFLLSSVLLHSPLLLAFSIAFAVGHIAISLNTYNRIRS